MTGALKAVHDKYAKALGEREEYQAEFQEAMLYNDQIGGLLNKVPPLHSSVTQMHSLQSLKTSLHFVAANLAFVK